MDNWADEVLAETISRLASNKRAEMIPYLRRYLNDPEDRIKEIHIGLGDQLGNWNDGVS